MNKTPVLAICMASALAACSSGGSSGSSTAVSGTVSAPGGTIAFFKPHGVDRLVDVFLPSSAYAGITGISTVAAGIPIKLIEVDSSGTQVGADIATGTTGTGGTYSLTVPAGFTPGPQYVVVATDGVSVEARVTSTTVDIDPVTNVASGIITTGGSLANLTAADADFIADSVESLAQNVDSTTNNTMSTLTSAFTTAVQENVDASNIINSMSASGQICGTVTDSNSAALANVVIVVRDFKDWVTRAKTRTDSTGAYCLHVPVAGATNPDGGTFTGNYIVGAINATGLSYAASEWWTIGGGANNQFSAEKISVPDTTTVTKDFQLAAAGGRIAGTIYATDGTTPLENIGVVIRDYQSDEPVVFTRSKADGTFRVNVAPGKYTVTARNFSLQPYAGGSYNGPTSGTSTPVTPGTSAADATPVTVTASTTTHTPFQLSAGAKIAGQVTDGTNPQPGINVRFYDNSGTTKQGAFIDGRPVNKAGNYRIWLQAGNYTVEARGQSSDVTASISTPVAASFTSSSIQTITAVLQDGSMNPVSQAKVSVYNNDSVTPDYSKQGMEVSDSDGEVTLYTSKANNLVEFKLDGGQTTLGSSVYLGQTALLSGTNAAQGTDLGTIQLPSGGELTGVVTDAGGNPLANALVTIRSGGTGNGARFVTTRSQSDGTYTVSLPAGTYNRVCAVYPGLALTSCPGNGSGSGGVTNSYVFQDSVAVAGGTSNTLNLQFP
jgi:hypothetical protein